MEVYRDAVVSALGRTFSTTPSQFEKRGIEDQLTILSVEFSIAPEWITRLTGYNRTRNCLAHRVGGVGLQDAIEVLDREKRVGVGSLLHFLPEEVLEICQTLQLASAAFGAIKAPS
jgi:hypothetical protein